MLPQQDAGTGVPEATSKPPASPHGLVDDVVDLSREIQALAHDQLQLATLEGKLAAKNLMAMIAAAVGMGILVVTAWLGLMGGMVLWLIGIGVAPVIALLGLTALNLAAALICYGLMRRWSHSLGFPATLRSLKAASLRQRNGAGA